MLLALCFVSLFGSYDSAEVTVQTPVGAVTGTVEDVAGIFTIRRFYGIPYAEPPVGNLRFKKPVLKEAFGDEFNATEKGSRCFQKRSGSASNGQPESEDCLTLNIFTPNDASSANKKAVMVWIHGGSFATGTAYDYEGGLLSATGDVIIVTLNYRLDILGFLSTGDSALPGNLGLWDQQLAIQWVHNNIESFGGDASQVTLFGESAGSACVIYQTFYPGNKGLFQRAIAQSGGITAAWAYVKKDPALNVHMIAEDVGCNRTTTAATVECLRTVSTDQIVELRAYPVYITPVYDNDFILDTPHRLISGNTRATNAVEMFQGVDLMLGINNADGLEMVYSWMALLGKDVFENFTASREEFEKVLVPDMLNGYYKMDVSDNKAAIRAVIHQYTDFSDPDDEGKRIKKLTEFATDALFATTAANTLDSHLMSPTKSTYAYLFAVKPLFRILPIPATFEGPDVMMHGDDILFVFGFGIEYVAADPTSDLYRVYASTMAMWTNFAKSGNPNTPGNVKEYLNIDWPQYGASKSYLEFTVNPVTKQNFRRQAVNLWSNLIPRTLGICPEVNQLPEYVTVSTPVGDILGKEEVVPVTRTCGYRVTKFMGIPYAESPSGDRRFKKPVAKAAFAETFNATVMGPTCYQQNLPMLNAIYPRSEDCLLLNIYVPHGAATNPLHRKAVMIWIHGGGLVFGQSNSYSDFGVLSGYGDVIVVTINYRLGLLGFLTTGDSSLPGNLGLWDQQLAIEWVNANIQAFGGDNNKITIFGQQSGAASVIYQSFYPGNKGLFQRAVAQGGTSHNVWSYKDISKALEYTRAVGQNLSCSLGRTDDFINCLRQKPISDIETFMNGYADFPLPVRDNDFIQDTPENLVSGASTVSAAMDAFYNVDLMMGANNFDGIFDIVMNGVQLPITEDRLVNTDMPHFLEMILGRQAPSDVTLTVLHEYKNWKDPTSDVARAHKVAELFTDAYFAVNAIRTADQHLKSPQNTATYMYQFGVKPTTRYVPIPASLEGADVASNGDELNFVTGKGIQDVSNDAIGRLQYNIYTAMMDMWSNFAKTGNPNTPVNVTHMIEATWPMYSVSRDYLDIKPEMTSAKNNFRSRAVNFWSRIIPEAMRLNEQQCLTSKGHFTSSPISFPAVALLVVTLLLL